jgi:hypothetical protein
MEAASSREATVLNRLSSELLLKSGIMAQPPPIWRFSP